MMIETCADIAGHIISDGGMRAPKSYAEGFVVLKCTSTTRWTRRL